MFVATLAGLIAVNQAFKFKKELDEKNPLNNQAKINNYLEEKFGNLQASKDINFDLTARLIFQSKGYGPDYKEYDKYIAAAHELAKLDNKPVNMQYVETAVHDMYGDKMEMVRTDEDMRKTSIHELGHAIAIMYKLYSSEILHYVEVETRQKTSTTGSYGHNIKLPIKMTNFKNEDELYNNIIVALCGGIAEQVFGEYDLKSKNLEALLVSEGCAGDMEVAYNNAEKIAARTILQNSYYRFIPFYVDFKIMLNYFNEDERAMLKVDAGVIISKCYDEAYQFITDHKHEIEMAIDLLQKNGSISGDDLYDLLKAPKPLYDFELGPLPKELAENYALRGDYNKHGSVDL